MRLTSVLKKIINLKREPLNPLTLLSRDYLYQTWFWCILNSHISTFLFPSQEETVYMFCCLSFVSATFWFCLKSSHDNQPEANVVCTQSFYNTQPNFVKDQECWSSLINWMFLLSLTNAPRHWGKLEKNKRRPTKTVCPKMSRGEHDQVDH